MARQRPTVAQVRALERKLAQLQAQIEHERNNLTCFDKEITCQILRGGSLYDYDDEGEKLKRFPDPKVGDIVIVEFWFTWLGGSDPSGFKIAVRLTSKPDERGVFKAVSLSSYVRPAERNDFYALDSKSTRNLLA